MLNIDKELFQWEKDRNIFVLENSPQITIVEFYNKNSQNSIRKYVSEGKVRIPNSLLKESFPITALACVEENEEAKVIFRKVFKVLARPKPQGYVDDPDIPDDPDLDKEIVFDGGVEN